MRGRSEFIDFDPDIHMEVKLDALETYAFARRDSTVLDALTVMAAVDYADLVIGRPAYTWKRELHISIPVYNGDLWNVPDVGAALNDALTFLTGDTWNISFRQRRGVPIKKPQDSLPFEPEVRRVIAYSNGLDSRAVAGIEDHKNPKSLLRVRVGSGGRQSMKKGQPIPFTSVPYRVRLDQRRRESSGRSRGFRYAMFGGIAAYLINSNEVVIPESGQGVFGPALTQTLQAYPDYRNHPRSTERISVFLKALFAHEIRFTYPRLFSTKGETLAEYLQFSEASLSETQSCWRDARWSSVGKKKRQCGVCSACLLRRLSFHSVGLTEEVGTYICDDLTQNTFEACLPTGVRGISSLRDYAIAGVRQLANFTDSYCSEEVIEAHASLMSMELDEPVDDITTGMGRLIQNHTREWEAFIESLGQVSFVRAWAEVPQ